MSGYEPGLSETAPTGGIVADLTPIRPCPRPDKQAYRTRGEALAEFWVTAQTRRHHPYLCRCGRWHITSKEQRCGTASP